MSPRLAWAVLVALLLPSGAGAQTVARLQLSLSDTNLGRSDCADNASIGLTITATDSRSQPVTGLTTQAQWEIFVDESATCEGTFAARSIEENDVVSSGSGVYRLTVSSQRIVDAAREKAETAPGDCGGDDGVSLTAVVCVKYLNDGTQNPVRASIELDIDTAGPPTPTLDSVESGDGLLHLRFSASRTPDRFRAYYRVAGSGGAGGSGGTGGDGGSGGAGGTGGTGGTAPTDEASACDDGADNDGDGRVDCRDPDCFQSGCVELCGDEAAEDEDGDGASNCQDADCASRAPCAEDCSNGVDDDGDGATDCGDADCSGLSIAGGGSCPGDVCVVDSCSGPGLDPACVATARVCGPCAAGDCLGAGCQTLRSCVGDASGRKREFCAGGQDDDGDGKIDCADPDCADTFASCDEGDDGAGGSGGTGGSGGSEPSLDLSSFTAGDEFGGTLTKGELDGLVNGVTYEVALVALDEEGNESAASNVLTGTPQEVDGFMDLYRKAGGTEAGGCTAGTGPMALLAFAVAALGLRSWRRTGSKEAR